MCSSDLEMDHNELNNAGPAVCPARFQAVVREKIDKTKHEGDAQ